MNGAPAAPWGHDRPVSLKAVLQREATGQCWVGHIAWERLQRLLAAPAPIPPDGILLASDPASRRSLTELVEFSYGILEATQSLLISAAIVSGLIFVPEKSKPRIRDSPRFTLAQDFSELSGIALEELRKTAARDYSVHLRPRLRQWHQQFSAAHPRLISTWGHGSGPVPLEPFRYLSTKPPRVRVKGAWCDLQRLATELDEIAVKLPFKARIGPASGPVEGH